MTKQRGERFDQSEEPDVYSMCVLKAQLNLIKMNIKRKHFLSEIYSLTGSEKWLHLECMYVL